jgi:ubiquinol-cytochrome c reductase cytochrome b subunit
MHAKGDEEPLSEELFPILTGYGGRSWLFDFVSDPQQHYAGGDSSNNAMPAFGEQLSPHDLEMLVRWMTGEYYRAAGSD